MAEGKGGPGWLVTLFGGALLVVLGLGLGVVVGVAFDEPAMVIGDVAEQGVELPWASSEDAEAPPAEVAELEPLGDLGTEDAPAVDVEGDEMKAPSPAAAPTPAGGFAVQVGAFGDSASAERLADELKAKGHDAYVSPGTGGGRWRVRVGPVPSREQAQGLAKTLKADEELPTWVVEEPRG